MRMWTSFRYRTSIIQMSINFTKFCEGKIGYLQLRSKDRQLSLHVSSNILQYKFQLLFRIKKGGGELGSWEKCWTGWVFSEPWSSNIPDFVFSKCKTLYICDEIAKLLIDDLNRKEVSTLFALSSILVELICLPPRHSDNVRMHIIWE